MWASVKTRRIPRRSGTAEGLVFESAAGVLSNLITLRSSTVHPAAIPRVCKEGNKDMSPNPSTAASLHKVQCSGFKETCLLLPLSSFPKESQRSANEYTKAKASDPSRLESLVAQRIDSFELYRRVTL
jgi:hypothetical protein